MQVIPSNIAESLHACPHWKSTKHNLFFSTTYEWSVLNFVIQKTVKMHYDFLLYVYSDWILLTGIRLVSTQDHDVGPAVSPLLGRGWGEVWGFLLFLHDETRMFPNHQQDAADLIVSCWEPSDSGSHQQSPALVWRDIFVHTCVCFCSVFYISVSVIFHTLFFTFWMWNCVNEEFKNMCL